MRLGLSKKEQTKWNKTPKQKKTKKSTLKAKKYTVKKDKFANVDMRDRTVTVRFNENELKKRVDFVVNIGVCQICQIDEVVAYPHHALDGISRKDDRTLVCVGANCGCHYAIHNLGFKGLAKTKEEIEEIGWSNNDDYLESINYKGIEQ